jgi:hypothetical protein
MDNFLNLIAQNASSYGREATLTRHPKRRELHVEGIRHGNAYGGPFRARH